MRVLDVDLVIIMSGKDKIGFEFTYVPHMNEPLEAPCFSIMAVATRMFSPPLSPLTRCGHPHALVDAIKP